MLNSEVVNGDKMLTVPSTLKQEYFFCRFPVDTKFYLYVKSCWLENPRRSFTVCPP